MKRSLTLLFLLPLSLWTAFALPEVLSKSPADLWAWRGPLIFLSGLLALWWMSAGIVLASRPRWLEQGLNGLDKLYQLHRNIGIGAGLLVLLHWQLEWLPKTLVKAGLIAGSGRPRRPRGDPQMWIEAAKVIGEWAGYLLLALVVIALIRRIPYHWFRQLHKAFGVIFLAGVFHGLLLMPASYWQSPLAWLSVAVAAAGVLPALLSLSGRIGRQRQTSASIQSIHQPAHGLLEIVCRPQVWRAPFRAICPRRFRQSPRRPASFHDRLSLGSAPRHAHAVHQGLGRFHSSFTRSPADRPIHSLGRPLRAV